MKYAWIFVLWLGVASAAKKSAFEAVLPVAIKSFFQDPDAFSRCRMDVGQMFFSRTEPWAVKMLDSYGKPESGMLDGHLKWPGSPEACRGVTAPAYKNELMSGNGFQGKYCAFYWKLKTPPELNAFSNIPLMSGVCVPSTCKSNDLMNTYPFVQEIFNAVVPAMSNASQDLKISSIDCFEDTFPEYPTIVTLIFTSALLIFVIFVTMLDYLWIFPAEKQNCDEIQRSKEKRYSTYSRTEYYIHQSSPWNRVKNVILCFSGIRNAAAILDLKETNPRLSFLHGMKVLSIFWVIMGHSHSHYANAERKILEHARASTSPGFQFIHHGFYAVDTFFFISSFLFAYVLLGSGKVKLNKQNGIFIIVHRYIRTCPTMMLSFALNVFVLKHVFSGPIWTEHVAMRLNCSAAWWTYPLYINNFFAANRDCASWLWYLAVDFQLFMMGIPVIAILQRSFVRGVLVIIGAILGTTLILAVIVFSRDLMTFFDYLYLIGTDPYNGRDKTQEAFEYVHSVPYARGTCFWMGLLYAVYALKVNHAKPFHLNQWRASLLLLGAVLAFLFVILTPVYVSRGAAGNAIFISLSRLAWGLGVTLVFQICFEYPHSFTNRFLSWRGFRLLSKLTFCLYLLHPIIMDITFSTGNYMPAYSLKNLTCATIGIIIFSLGLSFVYSVIVEAPCIKLAKVLLEKK